MSRLHITVLTTRNGNLTFVKADFQVLKVKFHAYNFKQAFYFLYKRYSVTLTTRKSFYTGFRSLPGCQTCMCKRGISDGTHLA